MAHIRTRQTADGTRYDVRYIVNGTERSDSFRSKSDAESRLTGVRADELVGLVTDPRGGERLFGEYAEQWLKHRLVKGRPLTPASARVTRVCSVVTCCRPSPRHFAADSVAGIA